MCHHFNERLGFCTSLEYLSVLDLPRGSVTDQKVTVVGN